MRISDLSSDVGSSDLGKAREDLQWRPDQRALLCNPRIGPLRNDPHLLPGDGCPENEAIKAAARLAPCPSWRKAMPKPLILWFEEIAIADVPAVGGKNASLGEMTAALSQKGVKVPSGFATTEIGRAHV